MQSTVNEAETCGGSVTEGLPDLEMEATRRALIAKRERRYGADSPKGHACSNLVEQIQNMRTYVRPAWATDERQTLPYLMSLQMKRLARRDSTDRNIDELSLARLREVLNYDSVTGILSWRFRLSPNCKLGEAAGQIGAHGYRKIRIDGRYYTASHLAWFHHYGVVPNGIVDHKDGDRDHNWIENLREASHSQNSQNMGRNSANTTGFKGVAVFNQPGQPTRYRALIRANGKRNFLGIFDTPEEAHEAYCKAAAELHGEFARTQ
jgi:hypothetical protein